ncbi:MAG TPA: hypothetical protein PLX35_16125, partial [Cyclobacteriaceae bacterium]|nr:hypothetical protein [Cyclobacteriaceae bacterium]
FYLSNFLTEALKQPGITKAGMQEILTATSRIESDHYITEVLTQAAPKVKQINDASLKDQYRLAAKKIESETYYGRAIRAID